MALLLPACLLFIKTLYFDFTTLDEQWMIIKNVAFIEKWASLKDCFIKPLNNSYYRPLLMASFILDYHLSQLSPFAYHLTNLLLHLISVLLLFSVLREVTNSIQKGFWLSLLFSVHPLTVHAVAWIPGRNDLLLFIFTALSLLYLHRLFSVPNFKNITLHLLFFLCSLLTKENAVILPFVYLVGFFFTRMKKKRLLLLLLTIWTLISIGFLYLHRYIMEGADVSAQLNLNGLKNFFLALISFTGKVLLPVNQSILPTIQPSHVLLSIVVILIIAWIIKRQQLDNKYLAFYGLTIFFSLLFIPVWFGAFRGSGEHYEHRIYTSFLGAALFLSQINLQTHSKQFQQMFLLIFFIFFIKTFLRLDVYKTSEKFIEAGLKERPDHYLFHVQKGEILYTKKQFAEAESSFSKSISIRPDKGELYNNRGTARYAMGQYQLAANDFSEAIARSSFKAEYYVNRCSAKNKLELVEESMADLVLLKGCCSQVIPQYLELEVNQKFEAKKKSNHIK